MNGQYQRGGAQPGAATANGGASNDANQSKTLWIGDVEPWMGEQDIQKMFDNIAPVVSVKLIRDKLKSQPVGYGFVEFENWEVAKEVFTTLNGQKVPGPTGAPQRVYKLNWASHGGGVARAQTTGGGGGGMPSGPGMERNQMPSGGGGGGFGGQQPPASGGGGDHQVYVGDLDATVTNPMLLSVFQEHYPSVHEAKVICDPISRKSKGYGFVKFGNKEESERSIQEMSGKFIGGRQIKMNYASQRNRQEGGQPPPVSRYPPQGGGYGQNPMNGHMPPQGHGLPGGYGAPPPIGAPPQYGGPGGPPGYGQGPPPGMMGNHPSHRENMDYGSRMPPYGQGMYGQGGPPPGHNGMDRGGYGGMGMGGGHNSYLSQQQQYGGSQHPGQYGAPPLGMSMGGGHQGGPPSQMDPRRGYEQSQNGPPPQQYPPSYGGQGGHNSMNQMGGYGQPQQQYPSPNRSRAAAGENVSSPTNFDQNLMGNHQPPSMSDPLLQLANQGSNLSGRGGNLPQNNFDQPLTAQDLLNQLNQQSTNVAQQLPNVDEYDPLGLDSVPKTSFHPLIESPEEPVKAPIENAQILKKKMPIGPFNCEEIDEINQEFLLEYYQNNSY